MPKVPTNKLEPGMKLARPVTKGNMVLLSKDTELTKTLIRKIQDMETGSVYIDDPSQHSIPKDEALAQLDQRFKNVENRPYMNLLKKVVREHIEGLYD
jgi:hypothetical protein